MRLIRELLLGSLVNLAPAQPLALVDSGAVRRSCVVASCR